MKDFLLGSPYDTKPFYKRPIFIIGASLVGVIVIIIIIAAASSSSSPSDTPSEETPIEELELSFESSNFKESAEVIANPDQGFYRPRIIHIEPDNFDPEFDHYAKIYHLEMDISAFSKKVNRKEDKKLTDYALNAIDDFLTSLKKENRSAMIRFAYDPDYEGEENMEPPLEMIETHIKQLGPIMNKHIDTITGIQAGMLGPYGEMHTSDIATLENRAKVFRYWLDNTIEIPILARTPHAIFKYFEKNLDEMEKFEIKPTDKEYRLGVFNDAYLSSADDDGTYRYDREREVNWLSKQCDHLPYGGESNANYKYSNLDYAIPEMFLLSTSYLNIEWYKSTLQKWRDTKYTKDYGNEEIFYGKSGFDYIDAHLGYRLVIDKISVKYKEGEEFYAVINIKNVGFGNLNKKKQMGIVYTDYESGKILDQKIDLGEFKVKKGNNNEVIVRSKLLAKSTKKYKVSLTVYSSVENGVMYFPIEFANVGGFNANTNGNYLFSVENGKLC